MAVRHGKCWSVFLMVLIAAGNAFAQGPRQPNVLLIVTDDQRGDTIGALGNKIIKTPTLDRLVRQGTVFTRAVSPNPICTPSRAEIMTGVSGFHNGVLGFGGKIKPNMPLLGKILAQAGYRTCYVGKWHNDGRPSSRGYAQCRGLFAGGGGKFDLNFSRDHHGRPVTGYRGWIFQTAERTLLPQEGVGLTPDISSKFADAAIEFLQDDLSRPFFLHVNFTAPHDPLLMPSGFQRQYDWRDIPLPANFAPEHPFDHGNLHGRDEKLLPWPRTPSDVRKDLAVYYAVISHLDQQVGRILAALAAHGRADSTVVIVTSDHGLAIGSHGLRGKQNMYEHTIGVPLVMRGPGIPAGATRSAQCYLRDLFPTICELCDVSVPPLVEGRSLVPVLRGDVDSVYSCIFAYFGDKQRMIRTDRWKLIHYPQINRDQLFEVCDDSHELHDRVHDPRCAGVLAELRQRLQAWQQEVGDPLAGK